MINNIIYNAYYPIKASEKIKQYISELINEKIPNLTKILLQRNSEAKKLSELYCDSTISIIITDNKIILYVIDNFPDEHLNDIDDETFENICIFELKNHHEYIISDSHDFVLIKNYDDYMWIFDDEKQNFKNYNIVEYNINEIFKQ